MPKKKSKSIATKSAEKPNDIYNLTLQVNQLEYTSKGKDLLEAIDNLNLHRMQVKTKSNLIISKNKRQTERYLPLRQLRLLLTPDSAFRKFFRYQVESFFELKYEIQRHI